MGWRGSSDLDLVICALLDGEGTIKDVVDRIDLDAWGRAFAGRAPDLGYQGIYMRLKRLEADGRVMRLKEQGANGAWLWRPLTREERFEAMERERREQEPPPDIQARFYKLEKEMGVNIIYALERRASGGRVYWHRCLVVRTNRGEAEWPLTSRETWGDVLVRAGLE